MSFMKNIFRYAAAGLLVCGLCTATPPAQALANKDTKQAPVDATKYLTKKFLKKNQIRDWLRVIATGKNSYQLRYFNIQDATPEEDEE